MRRIASPALTVFLALLLFTQMQLIAFAGVVFTAGEGLVLTGADGLVLTGADGLVLTGADGLVLTGADGLVLTGADGLVLTGADALTYTGVDGLVLTGADAAGLRSVDLELAALLDRLPDSSAVNVFVVFHHMPTEADLDSLRAVGVLGGTRFHNLPMVMINATRVQAAAISALPSVRSLYSNKTFEFFTNDTRALTGQTRVRTDTLLTTRNSGLPLAGRGVTTAVLDTGIDTTHTDLTYGTRVIQNVRVIDLQGTAPAFLYPTVAEGLVNSDLAMGHGTFVAGVLAGSGAGSGGYYGGMAPGAQMLGVAVGDVNLFHVLSGIDYILSRRVDLNVRVVNCSFGISGLFDVNDPVNIATKIMHDAGISVVFSAGNRGDQPNSLNPYSVAPWVIGVGSGTKNRKLSSFSSRGSAGYSPFSPTLIAPGENIVSTRAAGINLIGTSGLAGALVSQQNDLANIALLHLLRYTMSSGTSFAAPHVAGTIALMLEADPDLTPDEIKRVLQETATPMLGYSRYEVGAGYLNSYAAVRKAALGIQYGGFRESLLSQGISYVREALSQFSGTVATGSSYYTTLNVPDDTVFSTVQIAWVDRSTLGNNLTLTVSRDGQSVTSKPASSLARNWVRRTGVTLDRPSSGQWTITVTNTGDPLSAPQSFAGAVEVTRVSYGDLSDISQLSTLEQQAAKRALQTGLITTLPGGGFGGSSPATRLELARAVMLATGGFVPQYLPNTPSFADVPAGSDAVFVESVVNSPRGNLMAVTGSYFNPQSAADRLTVAIAIVKALGLDSLAQQSAWSNPGIADWNSMPLSSRGYVAVVLTQNLMNARGNNFSPFESITRAELAGAASALQEAAR